MPSKDELIPPPPDISAVSLPDFAPQKPSLKRNTLYNLGGSLFSMLAALVTVPLFLHKIGTDWYGVLAIIWLFIGYFGFFDLGLSRATANQMARLSTRQERATVFWTALLLNAVIGLIGGLVLWMVGGLAFQHVFKLSAGMRAAVTTMMPWLAATVPVITVTGVLTGVLEGCERFLLVNSLQVLGSVLLQVVPLLVAFLHGPDLRWLIAATVLTRMAAILPMFGGVLHTIPVGPPRLPSRRWAATLFGYGSWVTISNVLTPVFASIDKFMIGGISGISAVTYYSVPERLSRQASVFPGAMARTLFPRLSAAHHEDATATATRSLVVLTAVLTPLTVLLVLAMRPFLTHWIDAGFALLAGSVGAVISVSIWINGLAFVPYAFLDARGRPDLTAKFHLIEIVPHVALLWWALHRFGLIGGAWALVFVSALDAALLFWRSNLRLHALPCFWVSLAWVTLAFLLAPTYALLHGWFYLLAAVIVLATTKWGLSISDDVAGLLYSGLRRLRGYPA